MSIALGALGSWLTSFSITIGSLSAYIPDPGRITVSTMVLEESEDESSADLALPGPSSLRSLRPRSSVWRAGGDWLRGRKEEEEEEGIESSFLIGAGFDGLW